MDAVVILQREVNQDRAAFNHQVHAVCAELANSAATFVRLYTIEGDGAVLQEEIGGDQPSLCDAVLLIHGGGALALAERVAADLEGLPMQVYGAQIRHLKNDPVAAVVDGVSDGFYMVTPVRKMAGMSHDDFDAHWYNNHTPLALQHHTGMRDYYQIPVFEQRLGDEQHYDGLSLMGFLDRDAFFSGLFDSDEGKSIIEADAARFLDFEGLYPAFMSETIIR